MTRPGAFEQMDELANRREAAAMDMLYDYLARKYGKAVAFDTTMAMSKYDISYEDALAEALDRQDRQDHEAEVHLARYGF